MVASTMGCGSAGIGEGEDVGGVVGVISDVGGAGAIAYTVDVIAGVLVAGMVVEVGAMRPAGALQAASGRMSEKLMSSSSFIVGGPGRFP
jgi:hypothetical protein